tara:strand:- start:20083 stop:20604 length:522 start_codon:yes stop_codon:yes gene_type:complete
MNLEELEMIDRLSSAMAERIPQDVKSALGMYVEMRRSRLRTNISSRPDYEVQDIGKRLKALRDLNEVISNESESEALPHRPPEGESVARYQAYLSDLLTPDGWEDELLPTLKEILNACDLTFEEGGDVSGAKALRKEIEILIAVLQNIARNGRGARVELFEKEMNNGWTAQSR